MWRATSTLSILIVWFGFSIFIIYAALFIFPNLTRLDGLNFLVSRSSKNVYNDQIIVPGESKRHSLVLAAVKASDGRVAVVDKFLSKYGSPMTGHGKDFVAAADYYGLDWRLLPAIAFQESNLGKKIPKNSYNPFGWAMYTSKDYGVHFQDWSEAIFTVSAGIKKNYFDHGFTTPETIAVKYTKNANPSWVFAVKSAMQELSSFAF
jgi:hypothetical protein